MEKMVDKHLQIIRPRRISKSPKHVSSPTAQQTDAPSTPRQPIGVATFDEKTLYIPSMATKTLTITETLGKGDVDYWRC